MTDAADLTAAEKAAKEKALRLLSARAYASGGLMRKLREGFDEDAAEMAVRRMAELGLIDDEDYARRYASDCIKLKGFSVRRTKIALLEKGVPGDIAEAVLSEMDEDPAGAIKGIIHKKYARYLNDEKGLRKTTNALSRLGYSWGDIRAAIESLRRDGEIDSYGGEYDDQ